MFLLLVKSIESHEFMFHSMQKKMYVNTTPDHGAYRVWIWRKI